MNLRFPFSARHSCRPATIRTFDSLRHCEPKIALRSEPHRPQPAVSRKAGAETTQGGSIRNRLRADLEMQRRGNLNL